MKTDFKQKIAKLKEREAIEALSKGRRAIVAWSYADELPNHELEIFGNYDISERDWPEDGYNKIILKLIRHISNIPYEEL